MFLSGFTTWKEENDFSEQMMMANVINDDGNDSMMPSLDQEPV
jgi:hypothetical protein